MDFLALNSARPNQEIVRRVTPRATDEPDSVVNGAERLATGQVPPSRAPQQQQGGSRDESRAHRTTSWDYVTT
jgi:hypothetical protein